eukprot:6205718-Pleurochrysis_carterae.AAC.1
MANIEDLDGLFRDGLGSAVAAPLACRMAAERPDASELSTEVMRDCEALELELKLRLSRDN